MPAPVAGVRYTRAPGSSDWTAPGRPGLPGLPSTTRSTFDVFPNEVSHEGAVWTKAGGYLTSPGRSPLPVFDITDDFVLGETKPTWENTGCRKPISALTRNETVNLITTSDGQVIDSVHLPYGRIEVRHKNVTIRDCVINIGWAPNGTGAGQRIYIQNNVAVACNASFDTSGLRMEFVTCDPVNAGNENTVKGAGTRQTADSANVSAFFVGSGVAWRCSARNVTDGFMPDVQPAWPEKPFHVWGCYVQTRWLPFDPEQTDGTHNDGVQIAGGNGHGIAGSTLRNPDGGNADPATGYIIQGQCIVIDPYHAPASTGFPFNARDAGAASNIYIWKNWVSGAQSQISNWLPQTEGGPGTPGVDIIGNRHGGQCRWPILSTATAAATTRTLSGNVADEGGLRWNQTGSGSGTSLIAAGGSVGFTIAARSTTQGENRPNTSFAGCDQIVEPGQVAFLVGKGKDGSNNWVKTGAWSVVSNSGPAITLTQTTAGDGCTWAKFTAPKPTTTQTVVLRYTPTGVSATDDVTVTIPPWQTGA